jgi:hypothetical protein
MRLKTMTDKFYKLSHNLDRFDNYEDEDCQDGYLTEFDGYDKLERAFMDCATITVGGSKGIAEPEVTEDGIWNVLNAQMPSSIEFIGERGKTDAIDYPCIENADFWPIMSKKMVEILLSVRDFPHQILPITFCDYSGTPVNHDYVILNLLSLSDFMDFDKSLYTLEPTIVDPNKLMVRHIQKLVLKEPEGGFPPIFRVKWHTVSLYVSAEARAALEAADIKGLRFSRIWP